MSLLKNPDFESGLGPWRQTSGGPADVEVINDTDKARTGSRYHYRAELGGPGHPGDNAERDGIGVRACRKQ
jgi:hypothetical protein